MTSTDDIDKNITKVHSFIKEAVSKGAKVVTLPENFSYLKLEGEPYPFSESIDGKLITKFSKLAKEYKIYIICGSFPENIKASTKVYNTCVVINPFGKITATYRKIHLFDYSIDSPSALYESKVVEPGSDVVTFDIDGIKAGLAICYDLRFPELFRHLALNGIKILFMPSAFTTATGKDHWKVLIRARAIENQIYIVAPNQYGKHSKGRYSYGHSMIVGPWGHPIAIAEDKECIIMANIDFTYLNKVRDKLPCLNHIKSFLFNPIK
jgi:predicted amidohydrolase